MTSVITICYNDNMLRTQISVDENLYRRARMVAKKHGLSLAELCRRGLEQAVASEPSEQPWMSFAGSLQGEPGDSASIDTALYNRDRP